MALMPYIRHTSDIAPVTAPHGETVRECLGLAAGGSERHSLAHITLPPGTASLKHFHPFVEESYAILTGQGQVLIGEQEYPVHPGDVISIPVHTVHQIRNTGTSDLTFMAVCVPPWTPDCSVFLD